jgi:hypothetical protein
MSTLEHTKAYGLAERTEALQDAARTRLNAPTPHQVGPGSWAALIFAACRSSEINPQTSNYGAIS